LRPASEAPNHVFQVIVWCLVIHQKLFNGNYIRAILTGVWNG